MHESESLKVAADISDVFYTEVLREYKFCTERKWRLDFFIPAFRLGIEIQGGVYSGGRHVRSNGYLKDMEKYNSLTLHGIGLFQFTIIEISKRKHIELIKLFRTFIKREVNYGDETV